MMYEDDADRWLPRSFRQPTPPQKWRATVTMETHIRADRGGGTELIRSEVQSTFDYKVADGENAWLRAKQLADYHYGRDHHILTVVCELVRE